MYLGSNYYRAISEHNDPMVRQPSRPLVRVRNKSARSKWGPPLVAAALSGEKPLSVSLVKNTHTAL